MNNKGGIVFQGFDVLGVTRQISKANKKRQAMLLSDIELILGDNNPEYSAIRKLVLDSTNDFARSIVGFIFGDINM
jgi:hypothetical protein